MNEGWRWLYLISWSRDVGINSNDYCRFLADFWVGDMCLFDCSRSATSQHHGTCVSDWVYCVKHTVLDSHGWWHVFFMILIHWLMMCFRYRDRRPWCVFAIWDEYTISDVCSRSVIWLHDPRYIFSRRRIEL